METKDILNHLKEIKRKFHIHGDRKVPITDDEFYALILACDIIEEKIKEEEK